MEMVESVVLRLSISFKDPTCLKTFLLRYLSFSSIISNKINFTIIDVIILSFRCRIFIMDYCDYVLVCLETMI